MRRFKPSHEAGTVAPRREHDPILRDGQLPRLPSGETSLNIQHLGDSCAITDTADIAMLTLIIAQGKTRVAEAKPFQVENRERIQLCSTTCNIHNIIYSLALTAMLPPSHYQTDTDAHNNRFYHRRRILRYIAAPNKGNTRFLRGAGSEEFLRGVSSKAARGLTSRHNTLSHTTNPLA